MIKVKILQKFPNLILLNDENQITAYENTEEVSFE